MGTLLYSFLLLLSLLPIARLHSSLLFNQKYAEEVALGVAEARLKVPDLPAAVELCCTMHSLYAAFTPALLPALRANACLPPTSAETDAERSARLGDAAIKS